VKTDVAVQGSRHDSLVIKEHGPIRQGGVSKYNDSALTTPDSPPLPWARVQRWLAHRRAVAAILCVALLLACASLDTGLGADDHIHALILRGEVPFEGWARAPLDLFRFADGVPAHTRALMEQGVFPWWADPEAKLAFFRPITAATHWLDHRLWPDAPWLMHLQSLLWFAALLLLVSRLYAHLIQPGWVAALALLLFALDDARAPPLAWIANRNALVAATFAVATLVLHDLWRRGGRRAAGWAAPPMLVLGLLGGEGAVAVGGYLFAYAVFLDRGPWVRRLATLAPYAVVVVVWRAAYVALGYGVQGSGVYLDPASSPLAYAHAVLVRVPVLWLSQWGLPWSELWTLYPYMTDGAERWVFALALLVLAGTIALVAPLWRRDPRVRFWATGAALALLPAAATFPADRLLTLVALGAMPLLAMVVAWAVERLRQGPSRSAMPLRALLHGVVLVHVVLAVALFPMRARGIEAVRDALERADAGVPAGADIAQRTVIYANPPGDPFAAYVPIMRADAHRPRPAAQRWLATGLSDVRLTRVDAHRLHVQPEEGFVESPMERMLRSPGRPLAPGDVVTLSDVRIEITGQTPDARPASALFTFDRPLEHPSLLWLHWGVVGYEPFQPPSVGQTRVLPAIDLARATFGP
jgi:hypothetical protein